VESIVSWLGLLFVASTGAYVLQLAAGTLPTAAADQPDVTQQRGSGLDATATSSTHMLLITGLDETTGDRLQVDCVSVGDRVAIDALVVELKDLGDVAAQLCNPSAPVFRSDSRY